MTDLSLYGGPLKRTIIERAFGLCGQAVISDPLTPEEYELGLLAMNDIASSLSGLPFNLPAHGPGLTEDESGLAAADVLGFTARLAQEIAPNIGKQFSPNGGQATALSTLRSTYMVIPTMELGRQTIRGAGNRNARWGSAYFVTDVSDAETAQ